MATPSQTRLLRIFPRAQNIITRQGRDHDSLLVFERPVADSGERLLRAYLDTQELSSAAALAGAEARARAAALEKELRLHLGLVELDDPQVASRRDLMRTPTEVFTTADGLLERAAAIPDEDRKPHEQRLLEVVPDMLRDARESWQQTRLQLGGLASARERARDAAEDLNAQLVVLRRHLRTLLGGKHRDVAALRTTRAQRDEPEPEASMDLDHLGGSFSPPLPADDPEATAA